MNTPIYLLCLLLAAGIAQAGVPKNPLQTQDQQASYALAVDYMKSLQQDELSLDNQAFLQGLRDIQTGRGSRLSPETSRQAMDYLIVKRLKHHQEQAAANLEAGRTFLLANLFRDGVKELPSGLQYKILQPGNTNRHPKAGDGVSVRYRMTDIAGQEILNSSKDGTPRKMVLGNMIPGWNQALPLMQEGAKWQLFIPPDLAFGEPGSQDRRIKTNQTLVYEVELLGIIPAEEAHAEMDKPEISKPTVFK